MDLGPTEVIAVSDIVCGMSSMLLIESILCNKPVLCIQIGLRRKNPFVFCRRGILENITSVDALSDALKEMLIENKRKICKFQIMKDSAERIVNLMKKELCLN